MGCRSPRTTHGNPQDVAVTEKGVGEEGLASGIHGFQEALGSLVSVHVAEAHQAKGGRGDVY